MASKTNEIGQESGGRNPVDSLFSGGGEMGALIRAFDWSPTAVGPVSGWSQSLRTAVRIILTSRYPMFVWWGQELVNLYNDPYRAFLGTKHPGALGKSAREVWAEIWDQIGPRVDAVLLRGESTYDETLLLLMERHGYREETYFTFSYSPLPDDGGAIGGLFCAVTEGTQQVINERRLRLHRELGAAMAECRTPLQVCHAAAESLGHAHHDLPFSLIYLLDGDGKSLRRVGEAGIDPTHPAAADTVQIDTEKSPWPFAKVIETGEPLLVGDLTTRFANLPSGKWEQAPEHAVLMPIARQGQKTPACVLVAGLNPHLRFGDDFRGFVSVLSNQIAGALANVIAYETERRRAEQLAELDRAKTQFFSNISHEFRTPLTLMLGPLAEVLPVARERLDPKQVEQLTTARRNALRLLKLVNTLLDFSRIEAGRMQATLEPVDLPRFTAEIASGFISAMEKAGLRYSVECDAMPDPVYVDRDMWEKIVLNLLSNAFKFTLDGEVSLTLRSRGDSVDLSVRDTGVGIPEPERSRIFERFHRVESTRARTYEGSGIGLALVQELVKMHGGTVVVKNAPERGSVFTVSIPRRDASAGNARARSLEPNTIAAEAYVDEADRWVASASPDGSAPAGTIVDPLSARKTIVIADDNADMRNYLVHLLHDRYDVHAVSDGEQALTAARNLRPSLVLADVMMPRMDGFRLLQAVRADPSLSGTPVVLLSARAGEESRVEGFQAGADDYLLKPFTARELVARVATHINLATVRRQTERLRRLYDTILSNTPDLAYVFDLDHRFIYANRALLSMWGKTWEEAAGKNCLELGYEPWHAAMHDREIEQVIATRRPIRGEVPFTGTNGRRIYDYIFVPVLGPDGEVEAIAGTTRDITEHTEAEEALRRSEKLAATGRLAATVAHEINNPLEALTNFIYLARSASDIEAAHDYLSAAEEELGRISHMTKQTLGFYREIKGSGTVHVGSTVSSILKVFAGKLRNKGILAVPEIDGDPEIIAVPGEVRQLIANLVSNSIDAVPTSGRIRIRVSQATSGSHPGVRITVADSGPGIPRSIQSKLFEPFFTTKKEVGTGLGLWVCKSIVEKHNGTIRVKSSTVPQKSWTVFSVFLPAQQEPTAGEERLRQAV
jgi:PAS domain S-box-containing protein